MMVVQGHYIIKKKSNCLEQIAQTRETKHIMEVQPRSVSFALEMRRSYSKCFTSSRPTTVRCGASIFRTPTSYGNLKASLISAGKRHGRKAWKNHFGEHTTSQNQTGWFSHHHKCCQASLDIFEKPFYQCLREEKSIKWSHLGGHSRCQEQEACHPVKRIMKKIISTIDRQL